MFYIYWILMMISLITSFAYMSHALQGKNMKLFMTSILQCIISITLPLLNFLFVTKERWVNSLENEFVFLWQKIYEGNIMAYMILFGYLFMFLLVVINGRWITEKKKTHHIIL